MACAQTGSGKTAAFLVPTLSALFGKARELSNPRPMNRFDARGYRAEPLVLILAPTRELCSQTFDECRRVRKLFDLLLVSMFVMLILVNFLYSFVIEACFVLGKHLRINQTCP